MQARIIQQEIASARSELDRVTERLADLDIRSPGRGRFILPGARDLPDRYVNKGRLLAYVLDVKRPTIRVVVPQSRISLVRQQTENVQVRLVERIEQVYPAIIKREVPEADERLPSTALGITGGGSISIDPRDQQGTKTFQKLFQFDLELTEPLQQPFFGGRVYVRFFHGYEPLGFQWYRRLRQMLLRRFNV